MSDLRDCYLHDGLGNPIGSFNGALDVHDADVHTQLINEYFHRETGTNDTLAVAASAGATSITVTNGGLFAVGNDIKIVNGVQETTFPRITAIATNVLTLDRPLDKSFSIGDNVRVISFNMNVSGTLASPISFKLTPPPNEIWHIVRFLFTMVHTTAGDLGLFGNLTPVTNGVIIRGYDATTGTYRTFTNWKSNSDIKDDMYELNFDTRSGGGGVYGTTGKGALKEGTGATPRLDGLAGDYVEILIQDNLTGLNRFTLKAQGHVEAI